MEAIKTTGTYDLNIFDYSKATYARPSQKHVIRCEPLSVTYNVLTSVTRGPLSAYIDPSVYTCTAACNKLCILNRSYRSKMSSIL